MGFLLAGLGQYGLIAALIAGLLVTVATWRTVDVSKQRAIGAQAAVAKIEAKTNEALNAGRAAAEKSRAAPVPVPRRMSKPAPGYAD
jgi:Flp pilus assembly pilin Flp